MVGRIWLVVVDFVNVVVIWLICLDWGWCGVDYVFVLCFGVLFCFGGGVCFGLLIVLICIVGWDCVCSWVGYEFIFMECILYCVEGLVVGLCVVFVVNMFYFCYGKDDVDDNYDGNGVFLREVVFMVGFFILFW